MSSYPYLCCETFADEMKESRLQTHKRERGLETKRDSTQNMMIMT